MTVLKTWNGSAWEPIVAGDPLDAGTMSNEVITGKWTFNTGPRHGIQSFSGDGTISATGGRLVRFIGSAWNTLTLPQAEVGMEYEIHNDSAASNVTVAAGGSDTFNVFNVYTVFVPPGGSVTVRCYSPSVWRTIWPLGQMLAGGQSLRTAAFSYVGGDVVVIPAFGASGDGSTVIKVEAHFPFISLTNTDAHFYMRDSAIGQLDLGGKHGNTWDALHMEATITGFAGSRNFWVSLASTTGGGVTVNASTSAPNWIRASWAPGHTPTRP